MTMKEKKMKKRRRITMKGKKMKKRQRIMEGPIIVPHSDSTNRIAKKDRISELPDDVILVFLSLLGMKEAARTSLLSKRWRYSWTYLPDLDFDAENILGWKLDKNGFRSSRYVKWVNEVVMAHRAPIVKKFRVFYHLSGTYASDIDRWVDFCSRKGVQDLELHCCGLYYTWHWKFYNFGSIGQTLHFPRDAWIAPTFSNLKSFSPAGLRISGASLEFMFSKCLLLERLSLLYCLVLGSFRVVGSSLKLKYLKIKGCEVDKVEVSAPNLVSIECSGCCGAVVYKSVPSLVEAIFLDNYAKYLFERISHWSFQLKKLTIVVNKVDSSPTFIPSLVNVKYLTVTLNVGKGYNLRNWRHLIDVCPSLCEFKLVLCQSLSGFHRKIKRERMQATYCVHPCLEHFHLVGFNGCVLHVGFVSYVLKIAPLLKKLILDLRDPRSSHEVFRHSSAVPLSSRIKQFLAGVATNHPALDVVIT